MLEVGDYVVQVGSDQPVGVITALNGNLSATVCWGVADGHKYEEEHLQGVLKVMDYHILSPDEVVKRQAEKAGGKLIEESQKIQGL